MKIVTITGLKLQCDSINTDVTNETVEYILKELNSALAKREQFGDLSISVTDDTKIVTIEPVFSTEKIYG